MTLKLIKAALGILGVLCCAIAYALAIHSLDKIFPSLGSWLWVTATVPIIGAGVWYVLRPLK